MVTHLSLAPYLLQWTEDPLLVQLYIMVLLHGSESVWWVLATVPMKPVQNQVFGFQYSWFLAL